VALGASYASLTELKLYVDTTKTTFDALLTDALEAASRGIESVTHRQFNDAGSATAREYIPLSSGIVEVDDFHTTTGLVVEIDSAGDGSYATTLGATGYQLLPLNGVVAGQPGWPYSQIRSTGSTWFPCTTQRATVRVTARWGWAAVPKPVKQACLIVAQEIYKTKDAPFGVAGSDQYGTIRVRENQMVMKRLMPYIVDQVFAGA
jgi:hypothetical protein